MERGIGSAMVGVALKGHLLVGGADNFGAGGGGYLQYFVPRSCGVWSDDGSLGQSLEAAECRLDVLFGAPAVYTAQGFDSLPNRPHVFFDGSPPVAGDTLLAAVQREVDGDARVGDPGLPGVRCAIRLVLHIAIDDDIRGAEALELGADVICLL